MVPQPNNEPDGNEGGGDDFIIDVDQLGPDPSSPRPTGLGPMTSQPTSRLAKTDLFLDVDELKPEPTTVRTSIPTPMPPPAAPPVPTPPAVMPAYAPPAAPPPPMVTTPYPPPAYTAQPPSPVVVVAEPLPLPAAPPTGGGSGRSWLLGLVLLALTVGGGVAAWRLEWFDPSSPPRPNRVAQNPPADKKEQPPAVQPQKNEPKEVVPPPRKDPDPVPPKAEVPNPPEPPAKVNPEPPPAKVNPDPPGPPAKRAYVNPRDTYAAMVTHLRRTAGNQRRYQRFFTLDHLNNNLSISDAELERYRTGLAKMVQHIQPAWANGGVQPVDSARTVYSLDLRSVGWDRHDGWREVLKRYPYGVDCSEGPSQEARDVAALAGCDVPSVRADWFLTVAARPPLLARVAPKASEQIPQAVRALAARYEQPVGAEAAAFELGLPDPSRLREKIRSSDLLRNLGLSPFLDGGAVPRTAWAAAFAPAVTELELGLPLHTGGGR